MQGMVCDFIVDKNFHIFPIHKRVFNHESESESVGIQRKLICISHLFQLMNGVRSNKPNESFQLGSIAFILFFFDIQK